MKPLYEQAYEHLKEMIISNELSYQEIYSETKLAKKIGISRTPFRDAIHRLTQEGLVDIIPSKGFQLHQLSKQDVIETFQVRSALECYCTLEITKQHNTKRAQDLFKNLELVIQHMEEVMNTTHSIEIFAKHDFEFHIQIIKFLENAQLTSIFDTFMYRMQKLARLSLTREHRMEHTLLEHRNILKSMKSGDTQHIYEITLLHMNTPKKIHLEDLSTLLK